MWRGDLAALSADFDNDHGPFQSVDDYAVSSSSRSDDLVSWLLRTRLLVARWMEQIRC